MKTKSGLLIAVLLAWSLANTQTLSILHPEAIPYEGSFLRPQVEALEDSLLAVIHFSGLCFVAQQLGVPPPPCVSLENP